MVLRPGPPGRHGRTGTGVPGGSGHISPMGGGVELLHLSADRERAARAAKTCLLYTSDAADDM
eukprot:8941354-Alexandrium_andersonii.AAC.1